MSYASNYENFRYQNPAEQYLDAIQNGGSIQQGGEITDFPQYVPSEEGRKKRYSQLLSREQVNRAERRFWTKRGAEKQFDEWKDELRGSLPNKTWKKFKKDKLAGKRLHQICSKMKKNV